MVSLFLSCKYQIPSRPDHFPFIIFHLSGADADSTWKCNRGSALSKSEPGAIATALKYRILQVQATYEPRVRHSTDWGLVFYSLFLVLECGRYRSRFCTRVALLCALQIESTNDKWKMTYSSIGYYNGLIRPADVGSNLRFIKLSQLRM